MSLLSAYEQNKCSNYEEAIHSYNATIVSIESLQQIITHLNCREISHDHLESKRQVPCKTTTFMEQMSLDQKYHEAASNSYNACANLCSFLSRAFVDMRFHSS